MLQLPIFLLQRREEVGLAQFHQHAAVDVVGGIAAAVAGADLEHVLDAGHGDVHVGRRLRAEVLVADVDDLLVLDLQLARQHRLGARGVGEREVIALDHRAQEAHRELAALLQVAAPHHHAAEQPRDLLGGEIDQDVDALLARLAGGRLVDRGRLDLAGAHRGEPLGAAAVFLHRHVGARHAEALQRQRHGGIAFRAEARHADDAALEVGRGLHARRGRDHEADHVAHRRDQPQVAAGAVGLHHRRHADPHQVDLAGLQFLGAAAAAAHVDDLDLQAVGGIEAAFLRHPHRQHGVDGVGDADAERGELLGGGGEWRRRRQARRRRCAMMRRPLS